MYVKDDRIPGALDVNEGMGKDIPRRGLDDVLAELTAVRVEA